MAIIEVDSPSGQIVEFEIAGDKPTQKEFSAIREILSKQGGTPKESKPEFDTESGIKNATLRAVLSGAENNAEEEAILGKAGFGAEDYTRDARGRLALTPSGAAKLGVQSDKNILIDEEGFSRYDLADLAGIAPELTLGIAGAVGGQAAIPIPVVGAAIGAAGGAASGAALEEAIEGLAGVSKQSAGEIAKDIVTEGLIAGAAETVFGVPLLAFKTLTRATPGAVKEGGEELVRAGEAMELGFQPSLGQVGASPIPSRLQKMSENVIGTSKRMENNQRVMGELVSKYRSMISQSMDEPGVLGRKLLDTASAESQALKNAEREANKAVLRSLKDSSDLAGISATKNSLLDQEVLGLIENSAKSFLDQSGATYTAIDDVLEASIGKSSIIPTDPIKILANSLKDQYGAGSVIGESPVRDVALRLARDIDAMGDTASFRSIYDSIGNITKEMGESQAASSSKVMNLLTDVRNTLDNMLSVNAIENLAPATIQRIGDDGMRSLKEASKQVRAARDFWKSGLDDFEKIENAIGIKNIVRRVKNNQPIEVTEGLASRLIKNNKPQALKDLKFAVGDEYNTIRSKLASQFIFDTMEKSGLNSLDPTNFRGASFKKTIDDLGDTADELFGADVDAVRSLANRFGAIGNGLKIEQKIIDDAIAAGFEETGTVVGAMRNALRAGEEAMIAKRSGILEKMASGKMTVDEAAEVMASPSTNAAEFSRIFNSLDDSGKDTVRSYYMQNILEDVGATINSDRMKQFGNRIIESNKNGRLAQLYGEETSKEMMKLARTMKYLAEDSNAGNLVAQGIMANFIKNIPTILRFGALTRVFTGQGSLEAVNNAYKASRGLPIEQRASIVANVFKGLLSPVPQTAAQLTQEGAREAERQATSLIKNKMQEYDVSLPDTNTLQQLIPEPNKSSSLSAVSPVAPGPEQFYGIPQQASQPSIRQLAATNPGIAQALGIRGATAGLLNR